MSVLADPKAEQALIQHLVDTVVEEQVMKPMEKIGWGHGTPPAPEVVGRPAESEGAPVPEAKPAPEEKKVDDQPKPKEEEKPKVEQKTDAPKPDEVDWESLKTPDGKYLGKYNSKQEALKGAGHIVNMAKEAFARERLALEALERERTARQPSPAAPAAAPAPVVTDALTSKPMRSAKLESALAKLVEDGGVLDKEHMESLMDGFSDQSKLDSEYAVVKARNFDSEAERADTEKWNTVNAHMSKAHPDSLTFTDEIGLFVQANPLVGKAVSLMVNTGTVQGAIDASEFAWSQFQAAQTAQAALRVTENRKADEIKEIKLEEAEKVRKEATEEARKNAGILTSNAGGVHESPNVEDSSELVEAAAASMRSGSPQGAQQWRALTIGKSLTGPLFDGL